MSYLLSANTYLLNIYIQTYVLSYLLSANTYVLKKVPPVLVTVTLHNVGELTLSPVSLNVTGSMSVR